MPADHFAVRLSTDCLCFQSDKITIFNDFEIVILQSTQSELKLVTEREWKYEWLVVERGLVLMARQIVDKSAVNQRGKPQPVQGYWENAGMSADWIAGTYTKPRDSVLQLFEFRYWRSEWK